MDFNSILSKAQKNAQTVGKDLHAVHSELDTARRKEFKRIEMEKRMKAEEIRRKKEAAARRAPEPEPEKKFQIPKVKKEEPAIDKSKIAAFLAKKEQEKRKEDKEKQVERDRLAQLRLQANGGRANKKIAKHFGMNPIDLQIRFGTDREHIEKLRKQKERETEEHERLADSYRSGVYKAIALKKRTEEKVRKSDDGAPKTPHRVSTSKANSLFGLSSRHAHSKDHFSPPPEPKKKPMEKEPEKRKRPPPPAIDFSLLMKQAEAISTGKAPPAELTPIVPPTVPMKKPRMDDRDRPSSSRISTSSTSSMSRDRERDRQRELIPSSSKSSSSRSLPPSHSSQSREREKDRSSVPQKKTPATASSSLKDKEKGNGEKDKPIRGGRFVKGPTPPPLIPPPVPGKKYLPGDIRSKMLSNGSSSTYSHTPPPPAHHSSNGGGGGNGRGSDKDKYRDRSSSSSSLPRPKDVRDRDISRDKQRDKQRMPPPSSNRGPSSSSSSADRDRMREREKMDRERLREKEMRREIEKKKREKEKQRRYDSMSLIDRERMREFEQRRRAYSDYEEEEEELDDEEYDSEMDDFIDDGDMDVDDLSRQDLEDTLTMINKNYDKKKWRERERMIDDRKMEADFRTVAREEARSLRLGLLEDIKEARKGNSEKL